MTAGEAIVHLNDGNYEEQISQSEKPLLIDFWAPWCGPCKTLGPTIEEIAKLYKDRALVAKINVDENQKAATAYGVRSIPTLILFKDGKVLDTLVGLVPKERLEDFIKKAF